MADYDSSLPVRTESPADVAAQIVDSTGAYPWEIAATFEGLVTMRQGGNELVVNADGSLNANIVTTQVGDEVHEYGTIAALAPNTPTNLVNYTVTALKTLALKAVQMAGSGKFKAELKTGPTGLETTKAVFFGSTAQGSVEHEFPQPIEVVAGDKVLLIATNRDNQNQDVYGFINGVEV